MEVGGSIVSAGYQTEKRCGAGFRIFFRRECIRVFTSAVELFILYITRSRVCARARAYARKLRRKASENGNDTDKQMRIFFLDAEDCASNSFAGKFSKIIM